MQKEIIYVKTASFITEREKVIEEETKRDFRYKILNEKYFPNDNDSRGYVRQL